MKQVININFQGRVVPIEVTAYEILKSYIESLTRHFEKEEGKDEIINDIENRIGELFQERIKTGATCIVDDDVNAIIKSIGRPEDFDDADTATSSANTKADNQQQTNFTTASGKRRLFRDENHKVVGGVCSGLANYFDIDIAIVRIIFAILFFTFGFGLIPYIILWIAVPSSAITVIGSRKKKLFRDTDDKYIAGVCSGISHYFGINVWIPRALFLLPMLSVFSRNGWDGPFGVFDNLHFNFDAGTFFIYIILWIVLPEANTTAEKLEMKGEKVDMNSIKESVVEEMKGVQQRVQKFGKEAATLATEKGKVFGTEATTVVKKGGRSFGDIIVILVKVFVYFILGVVAFALITSLFAGGIAAINVFPAKDFILKAGWQSAFAWGTLIFFIIAPMIAVITWVIRKITKTKSNSKLLSLGFSAMWVIGWVSVIFLIASLSKDFKRSSNPNEQEVFLTNPTLNSLEITTNKTGSYYRNRNWFRTDPFDGIDEDTLFINNIKINIVKSTSDSFRVTTMKMARGATKIYADTLASLINFNALQKDSLLIIDRGISINKIDKFRNQHIVLTVFVPIGKKIKINGNLGRTVNLNFNSGITISEFDNIDFENVEHNWNEGTWYTMTKDGLVTLDGKPTDNYEMDNADIKINKIDGIDIDDGKQRVRINKDGIKVEESQSGNYRYNENGVPSKIDSIKENLKKEENKLKDSLEKQKQRIEKQLEKLDNNETTFFKLAHPSNLLMTILN
ncbi:MAG: PspC domain-containing protein [Ferruginibacter sp.]|nr:PspC domain-containing protein [Ferruginibacter sp.]